MISRLVTRNDLAEAVMLSGIGSQPMIFLLGTMIAIHYGGTKVSASERTRASLRYFRSPIFFAFVIGLALSIFVGPAAALVAATKLLVMPLLAWLSGKALGPAAWQLQVLCSAYDCDDRLAASLVLVTTALSAITLPVVFLLL